MYLYNIDVLHVSDGEEHHYSLQSNLDREREHDP